MRFVSKEMNVGKGKKKESNDFKIHFNLFGIYTKKKLTHKIKKKKKKSSKSKHYI